jgi:isopropylmalate/homocitrate/citramalate synthase/4-hydroxybenzoate polyprenyltransferase
VRLTALRRALVAHVETWRPYTTCYVGLVGLAGAGLTDPHAGLLREFAAWLIPTLGWLAGLYGGDYFDRELDAMAKPYRPIPSGRLPARLALWLMIVAAAAGAALGLLLQPRTVVWAAAALGCGLAYSMVLKAHGLLGNIARGAMTSCAVLFGGTLVAGWPAWRLVPIALAFCAHDVGSNIVGTLRDVEGDRAGGYQTLPVRHGISYARAVVVAAFGIAYLLPFSARPAPTRLWTAGMVLAAALAAVALAGLWQRPLTRPAALRAHEILVLERILFAGALVTLGFGAIGVPITLGLFVLAAVTQRTLRRRSEFAVQPAEQPTVDGPAVLAYVDAKLAALRIDPNTLAGLAGWHRLIEIRLREPELRLCLVVTGGAVHRLADDADRPDLPVLSIATSGAVFADIFLRQRLNPRRAYLSRKLTMDASARDMMHLNQLFNAFRAGSDDRPAFRAGLDDRPAFPAGLDDRPAAGSTVAEPSGPPVEDLMPAQVVISDTTLRDGEQMPGVAFSPEVKLTLARRLVELGVPLLEVGFPAVSAEESTAIRRIVDAELDAVIQVIARPADADVRAALDCGAQSIAIFIGTSEAHLQRKLRMDVGEAIRRVTEAVRRIKRAGRQAVVAAEDASRTDPELLCRFFAAAADAGADAVGIADTAGVADPWSMRELVRRVGEQCPVPIAVHCHNDLGLATANSLGGLLGGASGVQCSLLGIGERAGNAPLEQLVLSLEVNYRRHTGIRLDLLEPTARYLAALIGTPLPPFMPVVGEHAFVHESGLHVDGITRDPSTYEPYPPSLVGRSRRIVLGKHSGRSAVAEVAASDGVVLSDDEIDRVLRRVKNGHTHAASAVDVIREQVSERIPT